jgi:hypothetical protein
LELGDLLVGDPDRDVHVDHLPDVVFAMEHGGEARLDRWHLTEDERRLVDHPAHRAFLVGDGIAGDDARRFGLEAVAELRPIGWISPIAVPITTVAGSDETIESNAPTSLAESRS